MAKKGSSLEVCSMTGYGKSSYARENISIEVEVKTLNNRYLDINLRLPRDYSEYEMKLRESAQKYFKRGRVDIQVNRIITGKSEKSIKFNKTLYEKLKKLYVDEAKKLKVLEEEFLQEALIDILSKKDVLELSEEEGVDSGKEKEILFRLFSEACTKVLKARQNEGARLLKDVAERTEQLGICVKDITKVSKSSVQKIKDSLLLKIKGLDVKSLDKGRLEQEVALLALRSDISEELTRLDSHLKSLKSSFKNIDGKKLDFMLQELLREFNTIGSKSGDVKITGLVVEPKTHIERIREQSQNLE